MYRYEEITVGFFNEFSWSEKRLFTINKSEVCKQWNNMMLSNIKTDFCKPFVQFVCQFMTVSPVSVSSSAFSLCITYDQIQIPQLRLKTLHLWPPRHAAVFIPSTLPNLSSFLSLISCTISVALSPHLVTVQAVR